MKKRIGLRMGVIILLLIIGIVALCIYFSGDKNNYNPTEDNYQKVEI